MNKSLLPAVGLLAFGAAMSEPGIAGGPVSPQDPPTPAEGCVLFFNPSEPWGASCHDDCLMGACVLEEWFRPKSPHKRVYWCAEDCANQPCLGMAGWNTRTGETQFECAVVDCPTSAGCDELPLGEEIFCDCNQ